MLRLYYHWSIYESKKKVYSKIYQKKINTYIYINNNNSNTIFYGNFY